MFDFKKVILNFPVMNKLSPGFVIISLSFIVAHVESKNVGGYYWGGASQVLPVEKINANYLTHIYYAFLIVEDNGTLTIQDENRALREIGMLQRLPELKKINPDLKLLFSLSNQNQSFSTVVAQAALRKTLVQSCIDIVKKYNYDGIDLDWEFPEAVDKDNYIALLKDLKEGFKEYDILLTAAVRAIPIYDNTGYDVPQIAKYLDLINVMTYDYFGSWSSYTGQNSPLFPSSKDTAYEKGYLNVQAGGKLWLDAGATKDKINIGLPFYGRSFTLLNPENHDLKAPVTGAGSPVSPSYFQILQGYSNWTTVWDDEQKNPYKYSGDQWLGYDDKKSITEKVKYVLSQDFAGVFIWQLGGDDIEGVFSGTKQELLASINEVVKSSVNKERSSSNNSLYKKHKKIKQTEAGKKLLRKT
ncbi:chitinase-3-like protein 1 [Cylas formicarius]|uniref:chitinase-3-like protein 1 n=1 Tax=Cylas formicarius TaxID=197179 RepID=UPI0029589CAB|nr:chitinase-3-like protein 1 [Cylas formicarius]